jgi:hypothetical protein
MHAACFMALWHSMHVPRSRLSTTLTLSTFHLCLCCLQLLVLNKTDPGANPTVFTCGQWMGADVSDGQLTRTLKLGAESPLTSRKYKVSLLIADT